MGNELTPQIISPGPNTNKLFLTRIQKVSTSYSDQWGNYNIYQLQQKPYSYYLEYIENSIPQNELLQQKLRFYNNMPRNKNLVPVEYAQIVKRKELCAQFDGLKVFCIYYNFTLEDAIKLKIKQKNLFTEAQIIYILKSLLSIGKFYQTQLKASYYSGIYQSNRVYISPEGHAKIYPFNQHIFSAYSEMLLRQEQSASSEYMDSKKVSIDASSARNVGESRKKMTFSKYLSTQNNIKSQMIVKKTKLTTTLKKDCSVSSVSSKHSLVHQLHAKHSLVHQLQDLKPRSKQSYTNEDNQLSFMYQNKNELLQTTNKRDMFELGLLMMQLILLNESQNYYTALIKSDQTLPSSGIIGMQSQMLTSRNRVVTNITDPKSGTNNFKYLEQFQNDSGKIPNVDLIHFSLTKLLPKKHISKMLLSLIETMIFPQQNFKFTIEQIYNHVERIQQLCPQKKYCIKFDNNKDKQAQNNDVNSSKQFVKNKSTDPFMKTADLSYAFGWLESINQSKILPKLTLDPSISKDSFFTTNTHRLDELLNEKNLTSSMIEQDMENGTDSSQILSALKKSRKLVPTKLKSILSKGPEKAPEVEESVSTQRYRMKFG